MLIAINYIAIAVISGTYYLLAERYAPEMPLALGLSVALAAGLMMSVMNHLMLDRQFGARKGNMAFHDWNNLFLVFVVAASIMLSLGQLVFTRQLPEPRTRSQLLMLALYLLMLGLTAYSQGFRSQQDERSRNESI